MARKMKKFSAGGAQGRYDRRMADIEKDYAKAMTRKTGKAAEVAEAKRQQRIADAKDDLAKRTGADRTATRAAEAAAESNLTKTRKYGAPQTVTKDTAGPTGKVTDTLGAVSAPKSGIASKPQSFGAAFKEARARLGAGKTFTYNGKSFTTNIAGEGKSKSTPRTDTSASSAGSSTNTSTSKTDFRKVRGGSHSGSPTKPLPTSKFDRQAFVDLKVAAERGKPVNSQNPKLARMRAIAEAPGASRAAVQDYRRAVESNMYKAKGGTVKKETIMKKPVPANKKPMPKEPVTGGANTVPLTPERKEFLKELAKRNAKPGMAKGGKATKFGAAMVKKSADTKGRAMVKKAGGGKCYASGGSVSSASKRADGCAVKGKTKGTMLARGGSAMMRSRDSYGGANFKKGGSC